MPTEPGFDSIYTPEQELERLKPAMLKDGVDYDKLLPHERTLLAKRMAAALFAKAGVSNEPFFKAGWQG